MTQVIAFRKPLKFLCKKLWAMFLIVALTLLVLLLLYLLWMPMVLYINTINHQYYVQLKGLARASVEGHSEKLLRIRLNVLFLKFYFYPLQYKSKKKKQEKKERQQKRKRRFGFNKVVRMLRSFQVKRCYLNMDTGNCLTNAKMYPAFALMNYHLGGFHINFEGRNQLVLEVQNRPIRLLKSFINY